MTWTSEYVQARKLWIRTIHIKDPEKAKWMSYRSPMVVSVGKWSKELYLVKCTSHRRIILEKKGKQRKIPKEHMRWKVSIEGWGYRSVAQSLPGKCEVLSLIPFIEKKSALNSYQTQKSQISDHQSSSCQIIFYTSLLLCSTLILPLKGPEKLSPSCLSASCLCLEHSQT